MASGNLPAKRLVLCFDGTGNKFTATEEDTNIVKIYKLLDRNTEDQYHYYQPGIGTYVVGQQAAANPTGFFHRIRTWYDQTLDSMIGISFNSHVIAGYQFLMRYYAPGDKIYIFGFSRGAYTARFLTEMVHNIGLLSRGNEEMVQFAMDTFSSYQRLQGEDDKTTVKAHSPWWAFWKPKEEIDVTDQKRYMEEFQTTFCRDKVQVYFLGLFDCVNSVAQYGLKLSNKSTPYIPEAPAAHIRHAVSIGERRLRFRPALFLIGPHSAPDASKSVREVWFAGNHGDLGGGWTKYRDSDGEIPYIVSDIALRWIVEEALELDRTENDGNALAWRTEAVEEMIAHSKAQERAWSPPDGETQKQKAHIARFRKLLHDPIRYGGGLTFWATFEWRLLEYLPFSRWELERTPQGVKDYWVVKWLPPNWGAPRDIPDNAVFHYTVDKLLKSRMLEHRPKTGPPDGGAFSNFLRFIGLGKKQKKATDANAHHLVDSEG